MRNRIAEYPRGNKQGRPGFDRKGEKRAECRTRAIILPGGLKVKTAQRKSYLITWNGTLLVSVPLGVVTVT
jgi:hypothetical protein